MLETVSSLSALILMEIVLGIDNIVFIAVIAESLPKSVQFKARTVGLIIALVMRVLLLLAISWIMRLTQPWVEFFEVQFSGRDLILLLGGLFLVWKATQEIYKKMEGVEEKHGTKKNSASFGFVIFQIVLLDLVFSLDSVITAVGMVRELWMMVLAVVVAIGIMIAFAGSVAGFVNQHPSLKILALSFLILIGVMLIAEGMGQHINRGYIYFAMFFSLAVEFINMRVRKAYR